MKRAHVPESVRKSAKPELVKAMLGRVGSGEAKTMTYGLLAAAAGLHPQDGKFYTLLDEITEELEADAGCLVTAVVVRSHYPKRSGKRFFELAQELPGYDHEDEDAFYADQLGKAIKYWHAQAGTGALDTKAS